MANVTIYHPEIVHSTHLSADAAASATSSTVENNTGFATNDLVVFGKMGEENSEIVTLTSATGSTTLGHTGGLTFAHSARTIVSEIKYNQAEVYSSTSETGTYSLLATVSLAVDEAYTIYNDTTGTSSTWYKIRYKNSVATTYSDYSDAVQATGYLDDSLFSMTEEILEEYGDPDAKEVSRNRIKRILKSGVRNLLLKIIALYPDYHRNYTTQALTSGTATYDLPTRFLGFFRVDVNYGGSTATDAYKVETFESEAEGEPDTTYSKYNPRVFFRGDTFGLRPTPDSSSGYAFLWYWDYPAVMDSDADVHGLPYGARECLVSYALFRLFADKDVDKSAIYKKEYRDNTESLLEFIGQGRQNYTPRKVKITFASELYEDVE